MDLVRSWTRWISGALGASLLVPLAVMVAAAGIAVGGGGIGGLGALGQLVNGPREPLGAVPLPAAADTLAADPAALIATTADQTPATTRGGEDTRGGTDGGGTGPGGGEDGAGAPGGDGGGENGGREDDGGGTTPPGGGGTGTTPEPPADTDRPSALDQLAESTDPLTGQLPAPVGALTGDAIDQVVEIGEDVLGEPGTGQGLLGQLPR